MSKKVGPGLPAGTKVRVMSSPGRWSHCFEKGAVAEIVGPWEPGGYDLKVEGHHANQVIPFDELELVEELTPSQVLYNAAQNAAKAAVADTLGLRQKDVHAGMEAYRVAYRAVRIYQERSDD